MFLNDIQLYVIYCRVEGKIVCVCTLMNAWSLLTQGSFVGDRSMIMVYPASPVCFFYPVYMDGVC